MSYREDLIQAAVRAFAKRGPEGTTVSDIAHEAGVSQPRISQIFGSKEQAWSAAYTWSTVAVMASMAEQIGSLPEVSQVWEVTRQRHPEAMMVLLHCLSGSMHFPVMREAMRRTLAEMAALASDHGYSADAFIGAGVTTCLQASLGVQSLDQLTPTSPMMHSRTDGADRTSPMTHPIPDGTHRTSTLTAPTQFSP